MKAEKLTRRLTKDVLTSFDFKSPEAQKAFFDNLFLAGYFSDEALWEALHLLDATQVEVQSAAAGKPEKKWQLRDDSRWAAPREIIFTKLKAVTSAAENSEDPTQYLLDHLFEDEVFNSEDIEDFLLFLSQNAFGRDPNQERNELAKAKPWAITHKDRYLENAEKLEMIAEKTPTLKKCDESWIQGAARLRMLTRTKHLKRLQDEGIDIGQVRMLTGDREPWIEIDKMPTKQGETDAQSREETKEFLKNLALKNGIKLIGFKEKKFGANTRTCPEYAADELRKLTETMIAKEIYFEVFGKNLVEDEIISSQSAAAELRPTTIDNAADVTREKLITKIKADPTAKIEVMIVSNQPYVDRQTTASKRTVLSELKKAGIENASVNFHGIGERCEVGVTAIHSDFAALISENFQWKIFKEPSVRKCNPDNAMFQKRCKDLSLIPPTPIAEIKNAFVAELQNNLRAFVKMAYQHSSGNGLDLTIDNLFGDEFVKSSRKILDEKHDINSATKALHAEINRAIGKMVTPDTFNDLAEMALDKSFKTVLKLEKPTKNPALLNENLEEVIKTLSEKKLLARPSTLNISEAAAATLSRATSQVISVN